MDGCNAHHNAHCLTPLVIMHMALTPFLVPFQYFLAQRFDTSFFVFEGLLQKPLDKKLGYFIARLY